MKFEQRSDVDEMHVHICHLKAEKEALQIRFNALEKSVANSTAVVMAFHLINLFQVYYLSLNWSSVINEYNNDKDKMENYVISPLKFNQNKEVFNAKYHMPSEIPLLSDIIDLYQEHHDELNYNSIKTILMQETFLNECEEHFRTHHISERTTRVCLPILQKMMDLKTTGKLRGL